MLNTVFLVLGTKYAKNYYYIILLLLKSITIAIIFSCASIVDVVFFTIVCKEKAVSLDESKITAKKLFFYLNLSNLQ